MISLCYLVTFRVIYVLCEKLKHGVKWPKFVLSKIDQKMTIFYSFIEPCYFWCPSGFGGKLEGLKKVIHANIFFIHNARKTREKCEKNARKYICYDII